ncbi:ROK family protein [Paenibacillus senegalensis]|uniref:ROK family protein n=1 Tax=Paenibacillus senegalensis TaxID=1465766 RepID=UPI000288ED6C|nr:ROK family protein [Paenibacillus senegalensis]
MSRLAIGVDIGGTKIHFAAVDPEGRIVVDEITPTDAQQGADAVMDKVIRGITSIENQLQAKDLLSAVEGIGIGSAGQIDFESGEVVFATDSLPGWKGTKIRETIAKQFHKPVFVDNDVNVIAWAEKRYGAARPYESFICLAVGTGIGGAIVEKGHLVRGAFGGAGELGHLSVNFEGPLCSCGNRGCIELYASGTGIARVARELIAERGWEPAWQPDARSLGAAWLAGDSQADEVMEKVIQAFSTALGSIIHTFNPEAIIVGGGVSALGKPFFDRLEQATEPKTAPAMWSATRLLPAEIGTGAGVVGAASQVWLYSGSSSIN